MVSSSPSSSITTKPFLSSSSSSLQFPNLSSPPVRISFRRNFEVKAAGSTFGTYFRVTYGESHGGGVGCVVDGCPPRLPLSEADLQVDLDRSCTDGGGHGGIGAR